MNKKVRINCHARGKRYAVMPIKAYTYIYIYRPSKLFFQLIYIQEAGNMSEWLIKSACVQNCNS